jgi:serine/threonine protein kinase
MAEPAQIIDRYEVLRTLGGGGMAVVYLARHIDLDRFAALKEMRAVGDLNVNLAQRFLRESRVASALSHPNIVTVYDYIEHNGTPYIAMEYLQGGSLRPRIGHMTCAQILGVLEAVLAALTEAERQHTVHRDIKPENLLVTWDGRIKITDFGIAKATKTLQTMSFATAPGTTLGTPAYMAPEQAMAREVGPWTDLYSLGCVAFELFTGHPPFEGDDPMAIMLHQVNEPIPELRSLEPTIDMRLSDWAARLLRKDPRRRIQSAAQALSELEEIAVALLGPRWRRDARLTATAAHTGAANPLTPPPVDDPPRADDDYESFAWGLAAPATPPPEEPADHSEPTPGHDAAGELSGTLAGAGPAVRVKPRRPSLTIAPRRPFTEAATPRVAPWRARRRTLVPLAGVGAVATALLVLVLGHGSAPAGSTSPTPSPTFTPRRAELASGPLTAAAPPGWARVSSVAKTPGLDFRSAAAAAVHGDARLGFLVVGRLGSAADNESLLPPAFLQRLGLRPGVVPDRRAVRLGSRPIAAYRYDDLRPIGFGRAVTVFVVPTGAGVAAVECVAGAGSAAPLAHGCADSADSLSVRAATFPVGPSRAFARTVNARLSRLQASLRRDRARYQAARTPTAQGAAGRRLRADYDRSVVSLRAGRLSPADQALSGELVVALARAARAYGRLAGAASAGHANAYAAEARRAARADSAMRRALHALATSAYRGLIADSFPAWMIPSLKSPLRPGGGSPSGGNPSGGNPSGGNPSGGNLSGGNPSGGSTSRGGGSGGSTSGGSKSGGSKSGGSTSGGSTSGGSTSGGSTSGG